MNLRKLLASVQNRDSIPVMMMLAKATGNRALQLKKHLVITILLFVTGACATLNSNPAAVNQESEASGSASSTSEISAKERKEITPFSELSYPARMRYMRDVITPELGASFATFDAKRYRRFRCSSCHGKGARYGDYSMPSPSLMPLESEEHLKKSQKHDPDMIAFMEQTVAPQMAELLGKKQFNHKTNQGYSCFECHMKK